MEARFAVDVARVRALIRRAHAFRATIVDAGVCALSFGLVVACSSALLLGLLAACSPTIVVDRSVVHTMSGERDRMCFLGGCWTYFHIDWGFDLCWRRERDAWRGELRAHGAMSGGWTETYDVVPGTEPHAVIHEQCLPGTACAYVGEGTSTQPLVFEGWNDVTYEPCDNSDATHDACARGAPLLMFGMTSPTIWLGNDPVAHRPLFARNGTVYALERVPHSPSSPGCVR